MYIVIFTGGNAPPPRMAETFFKDIRIESADTFIIAADSGIETLEQYAAHFPAIDFSPDSILGDWDSLGDKRILQKYPTEIIQNHIIDKDYTDTELALSAAYKVAKKCDDVCKIILIGAGGGDRIDHLLAVFDLFATELRPTVWLSGRQFLYFLGERSRTEVHNLEIGDMVSVMRTSEGRVGGGIRSEGFLWESSLFRKEGIPSISNRISPAFFREKKPVVLSVKSGNFVLAAPHSARVVVKNLP